MKKVFSLKKYITSEVSNPFEQDDNYETLLHALKVGWPQKCDGLIKEECNQLGFIVCDDWMEEVE